MKIVVGTIIGIIGSILIIWGNINLVRYVLTLVPSSDWSGLIKIIIIFIDVWFTAGLCLIHSLIGVIVGSILEKGI